MAFPSDLEIARAAKLAPLGDIAAQMDLPADLLEMHGDEVTELLDSVNLKIPEIDLTEESTWPRI